MQRFNCARRVLTAALLLCLATVRPLTASAADSPSAPAATTMAAAASAFLKSLGDKELAKTQLSFNDPGRLDWHYIPKDARKGLQLKEMTAAQREKALALLHSGLSDVGYKKATTIMSLESILYAFESKTKGGPVRDPDRYYFTVFGTPSDQGEWGWSCEGHHLSLNYTLKGGKVVASTPQFLGSNPAVIDDNQGVGPAVGTRNLAQEEQLSFELLKAFTPEQRAKAVVGNKPPTDFSGGGEAQPERDEPVGLAAKDMTDEQRKLLLSLVETYAGNLPTEVAAARIDEIKQAGVDELYFAWKGADKPGVGHYYHIQGPTFSLELINVQAGASGNPANHIHSMWRSFKGDFGLQPSK